VCAREPVKPIKDFPSLALLAPFSHLSEYTIVPVSSSDVCCTTTTVVSSAALEYPHLSTELFVIVFMLWVDKYRPKNLNDLDYHDDISLRLKCLAKNPASLPHLFFYGPSGSGKRTRITSFLGALFGPTAHKLKLTQRSFTTPTGMTFEIHMISSEHHMELSPGDAGKNDRFVIQDILKDIASSKNISSSLANMKGGGGVFGNGCNNIKNVTNANSERNAAKESEIKVVVLNQVDKLSRQAQAALRRTMEKYAASCRLILCCDSPSKLIAPLRSRCLGIRVGAPSEEQVRRKFMLLLLWWWSGVLVCSLYFAMIYRRHILSLHLTAR
jgi:replication factor C subunit 3/5